MLTLDFSGRSLSDITAICSWQDDTFITTSANDITVWSLSTRRVSESLTVPYEIIHASSTSSHLILQSRTEIHILDSNFAEVSTLESDNGLCHVQTFDTYLLYVLNSQIVLYDILTSSPISSVSIPSKVGCVVSLHAINGTIWSGFEDGSIYVISYPEMNLMKDMKVHDAPVAIITSVRYGKTKCEQDEKTVLTYGLDGQLVVFRNEKILKRVYVSSVISISSLTLLSSKGKFQVIAGSRDGAIRLITLNENEDIIEVKEVPFHKGNVIGMLNVQREVVHEHKLSTLNAIQRLERKGKMMRMWSGLITVSSDGLLAWWKLDD